MSRAYQGPRSPAPRPGDFRSRARRRKGAWADAVVFGAVWGAMEVTVGTFLHTLRVPLGGMTLSAAAAGLLYAGARLRSDPWLPARAGIIAASCRAVVPAGVILPQMVAISMEGLLVALALRALGRNPTGAALSGVLVTSWSLGQKFVGQLVFYGATVIDLYVSLVRQGASWLGTSPGTLGWALAGLVLAFTWSLGLLGAAVGHLIVRQAGRLPPVALAGPSGQQLAPSRGAALSHATEPSRPIVPALLVVVAAVGAQAFGGVVGSLTGLLAVGAFVVAREPRVLRRAGRLRFWILTLALASLCGLALGDRTATFVGLPVSPSGLIAGLRMVARAALFVLALGLIASRLDRDRVLALFTRLGLRGFGASLAVAVELVPAMIDGWRWVMERGASGERAPFTARVAALLEGAGVLAERVSIDGDRAGLSLFVVTGEPGSGKTRFLEELVASARTRGTRLAGFIQPRTNTKKRTNYDLVLLSSDERLPFMRRGAGGQPSFDDEGWRRAREALRDADGALVVVDELGRVEADGGGHLPALKRGIVVGEVQRLVVSAREDRLDDILDALDLEPARLLRLPASDAERRAFVDEVLVADRAEPIAEKMDAGGADE